MVQSRVHGRGCKSVGSCFEYQMELGIKLAYYRSLGGLIEVLSKLHLWWNVEEVK